MRKSSIGRLDGVGSDLARLPSLVRLYLLALTFFGGPWTCWVTSEFDSVEGHGGSSEGSDGVDIKESETMIGATDWGHVVDRIGGERDEKKELDRRGSTAAQLSLRPEDPTGSETERGEHGSWIPGCRPERKWPAVIIVQLGRAGRSNPRKV